MSNEMRTVLAELADEIKSAALEWKSSAYQSWPSPSPSDREMRKTAQADMKAMNSVAALVKSGQLTDAYDRASGLDTIVREAVPEKFWKFAESVARLRRP